MRRTARVGISLWQPWASLIAIGAKQLELCIPCGDQAKREAPGVSVVPVSSVVPERAR